MLSRVGAGFTFSLNAAWSRLILSQLFYPHSMTDSVSPHAIRSKNEGPRDYPLIAGPGLLPDSVYEGRYFVANGGDAVPAAQFKGFVGAGQVPVDGLVHGPGGLVFPQVV